MRGITTISQFFSLLLLLQCAYAQTTIRMMHYNLLHYGNMAGCSETVNNTTAKDGYLKTIVKYLDPQIITVNEMSESETYAQRILTSVLNTDGVTYYKKATLTGNGFGLSNMIYYDSRNFTLSKQEQISKDLSGGNLTRIVDVYTLFYNDPDLAITLDTVYLTCIVAHLKAANTASDIAQREKETAAIMDFLNKNKKPGNFLLSGDLNLKTSTEGAYSNLMNVANTMRFYDPINMPGDWNGNSLFKNIHTQCPQYTANGCYSGGGMDDRFDFILASSHIIGDSSKVKYISGSYRAVGNDGTSFNSNLNTTNNSSVPSNVASALFSMSDHLPVALDISINKNSVGVNEQAPVSEITVNNPVHETINIFLKGISLQNHSFEIYSLHGQLLEQFFLEKQNDWISLPVGNLDRGIYILRILTDKRIVIKKIVRL